jgi:hypothetical protein
MPSSSTVQIIAWPLFAHPLITILFIVLCFWARPEISPIYFGSLIPGRKLLWSRASKSGTSRLEIGSSGSIFEYTGPSGKPLMRFFDEDDLVIESIGGRVLVSMRLRDENGHIVAELRRNQWKISPGRAWDRNYTKDALEVRGADGSIVLQVRVLDDRIQLQGTWRETDGSGVRLVSHPSGKGGVLVIRPKGFLPTDPKIEPLFEYPSEKNFGRLRTEE